jgi:riboflavin kinase / FMN adenylyltransferase
MTCYNHIAVTTHFVTKQIKGKGRGKFLGFPTINMEVPEGFDIANGVYAAWVTIAGTRFRGALHWGPIPTFDETKKSLEVFLLGLGEHELSHADLSVVSVEIKEKIRDIIKFPSVDTLTRQMEKDVARVRKILTE